MREIWRTVEGCEGYYEVSNKGNIRSLDRMTWNDNNKAFHHYMGKTMKFNPDSKNYAELHGSINGKIVRLSVHRCVAISFIPNPENKPQVNHKDGNKRNNHINNLEWCTSSENNKHAHQTGLSNSNHCLGSKNFSSVLAEKDIPEIRLLHSEGMNCNRIGKKYNVHRNSIANIITGATWKHV